MGIREDKDFRKSMVETRVPMTLRDHFLQDPFFNSSWSDMEKVRDNFFQRASERFEENCNKSNRLERKNSQEKDKDSTMSRSWMLPRKWMMPDMFDENLTDVNQDTNLINLKNEDSKMEISLNTAGYKPSELQVNVVDGEITIEGKHEEKTEAGHTMLSRQFSRRYNLPAEAKLDGVESNLSQDGILVITVPKEKRINEVKESQKLGLRNQTSAVNKDPTKPSESIVPMKMRDSFFDDPFFKDKWLNINSSQKNFFEESQKRFEESWKRMESDKMTSRPNSIMSNHSESILKSKDSNEIRIVNDDSKLEISLDTTGYKPDELKVSAGQGSISVEGKHEEKSEAGHVMVARQFSRKYSLPTKAKAEEVVSNLSQDGVLVISVPKREVVEENKAVHITVN